MKRYERGTKVTRSLKAGCLGAILAMSAITVIAVVFVSLYVPGAWREKSFIENPAQLSIFIAGVIGFILGFVIEIRRKL